MGWVTLKARSADGTVHELVADGERIDDASGRRAIVHSLREIDSRPLYSFVAAPLEPTRDPSACMHGAAFERLPVPVATHDSRRFIAVNAQARHVVGGDPTGREPSAMTHPDSSAAGRERRRLALDQGHPLRDIHIKIKGLDGRVLHCSIDSQPLRHNSSSMLVLTVRGTRY